MAEEGKSYFLTVTLVLLGLCLVVPVYLNYLQQLEEETKHYLQVEHEKTVIVGRGIEGAFESIYTNLRTIARLPGIRSIDRHAENFDANARQTTQESYNNLANLVALTEVYIVPLNFNPEAIDPLTGKLQEPMIMFDELIVGRTASQSSSAAVPEGEAIEEIEIHEYRLIQSQLAWFQQYFPTEQHIRGLEYPAIVGAEIIICDNTRYDPRNPKEADRSGIVYSVPFFDLNGKLRGCVSGIILTDALRDLLPSGDYALHSSAYDYTVELREEGKVHPSDRWIAAGMANPKLVYSETLDLDLVDETGRWLLWAGRSHGHFWDRPDHSAMRQMAGFGYAGALTLTLITWIIARLWDRNRQVIQAKNRDLEIHLEQMSSGRARLTEAQRLAKLGSWEWYAGSKTFECSSELQRILGFNAEKFLLEPDAMITLVHPEDRDAIRDCLNTISRNGKPFSLDHRLTLSCGTEFFVHHQAEAELDAAGQVSRVRGTLQDITERKSTDEKILLAGKVFESSSEAIMVTDRQSHILDVNHAFTRMTGYQKSEVIGEKPNILKSGRHSDEFYRAMWKELLGRGAWQGEVWNRKKNGEVFPWWTAVNAVFNDEGERTHFVSISADITKKKETEERLHHLAHYDPLTGLPNRNLLHDRLDQALKQAERSEMTLAVLFLDLDRFKNINDSLGHPAGDELLIAVGRRLQTIVRSSDTVARLGGDEFTILINEITDPRSAAQVAQKVVDLFTEPFDLAGREIYASVSIGISLYPDNGTNSDALYQTADVALYHAKEQGRSHYKFYSEEINRMTAERLSLEADLRKGLEREEFQLYYQPQLDLRTKKLCGMEALMRWIHPVKGFIPPDIFIPIAEESGLIGRLGELCLREACRQNEQWQATGYPVMPVAVNLSAKQFLDQEITENIRDALLESGLAPTHLELEITEGTLLRDIDQTAKVLSDLKDMGVTVAIDDFGTGYSSLAYLKRLPIDKLKIDKSFLQEKVLSSDNEAIINAVIAMAHNMGMEVIAEGVETDNVLDFLISRGCDQIQGYWYSRPLPVKQFVSFIVHVQEGALPKLSQIKELR